MISRLAGFVLAVLTLAALLPASASAHYDGELLPDSVAVMEYSMIINMKPDDTLTRNKLGMVYIRQAKLVKAREQFGEILKIKPGDFDALDSLGMVSEKEGKYAEAVKWYGMALKVRKDDKGVRERYNAAAEKARMKERR